MSAELRVAGHMAITNVVCEFIKHEKHVRMARGGDGLPKVSPRPAMPNPSTPCGRAAYERPYGRFNGGPPARRATCGRLLPLWTPHAVRLCCHRKLALAHSARKEEGRRGGAPEPLLFLCLHE
jgi:hypothetical protein